jgi:transposase
MGARTTVWTEQKVQRLSEVWNEGKSRRAIAEEFGVSEFAISAAIGRFRERDPERFQKRAKGRNPPGALLAAAVKRGWKVLDVKETLLEVLNEEPTLVENLLDDGR